MTAPRASFGATPQALETWGGVIRSLVGSGRVIHNESHTRALGDKTREGSVEAGRLLYLSQVARLTSGASHGHRSLCASFNTAAGAGER